MYKEYLGEGYHERIRKMLTCNEELLPNRIIDADANIGAMKYYNPCFGKMTLTANRLTQRKNSNNYQTVALLSCVIPVWQ